MVPTGGSGFVFNYQVSLGTVIDNITHEHGTIKHDGYLKREMDYVSDQDGQAGMRVDMFKVSHDETELDIFKSKGKILAQFGEKGELKVGLWGTPKAEELLGNKNAEIKPVFQEMTFNSMLMSGALTNLPLLNTVLSKASEGDITQLHIKRTDDEGVFIKAKFNPHNVYEDGNRKEGFDEISIKLEKDGTYKGGYFPNSTEGFHPDMRRFDNNTPLKF
jgi:hypothetical protein